MRPIVTIFFGILPLTLAFLPIDESRQGNKARIAYDLTNEVSLTSIEISYSNLEHTYHIT